MPNPYQASSTPPVDAGPPDERLLRLVLTRLDRARVHPPTALNHILQWRSVPLQIIGAALTSCLFYLAGLPNEWIVGTLGFYLGTAIRDLSYARMYARLWPVQRDLLDWSKIGAMLKERGLPSHGAQ
jgi:hypothetical protein